MHWRAGAANVRPASIARDVRAYGGGESGVGERERVRKGMGEVVVIAASCSCKSESSNLPSLLRQQSLAVGALAGWLVPAELSSCASESRTLSTHHRIPQSLPSCLPGWIGIDASLSSTEVDTSSDEILLCGVPWNITSAC